MLEAILGSKSAEQVLIFLAARGDGYGTQIAEFFDAELFAIQQQLKKLEGASVLISRKVGRTRLYQYNPRYPFLEELMTLLLRALEFYPEPVRERLLMNRRRPRQAGKPL